MNRSPKSHSFASVLCARYLRIYDSFNVENLNSYNSFSSIRIIVQVEGIVLKDRDTVTAKREKIRMFDERPRIRCTNDVIVHY